MTTVSDALRNVYRNLHGRLIAPHQPDGVRWMLGRELQSIAPKGGIVADEMGLGKTISSLAVIIGNELTKPTLIVAPKTLAGQWARECEKFTGITPFLVDARDACRIKLQDLEYCRVVITSYHALLPKLTGPNVLLDKEWGRVILDEAHIIKNPKRKITMNCKQLKADVKWCLTGTPITSRKKDFLALMQFVGVDSTDYKEMRDTYVMRRTFEDLCGVCERLRLPKCDIEERLVELSDEEQQVYDDLCDEGRMCLRAYESLPTNAGGRREGMGYLIELITRLRQTVVHPQLVHSGRNYDVAWTGPCSKLAALRDMIRAQPFGSKTLIFTHWNIEMEAIETMLLGEGLRVLKMNGKTDHVLRDDVTHAFNTSSSVDVLIVQIDTGGCGLNLQAATHVYINSLAWNASSELQAIARAHRIGVDHEVKVTRLVVENTIDEYILQKQQNKLGYAAEILGDDRIQSKLQLSLKISDLKTIFGDDADE